ncbi:TIGR03619 family F420-dependent LLM class oxidoreductase [Actinomadura citrea]|uniref:Putative F420-dependent oxidoreductase n=1 Tax=Actinomadura citrea TaxID=46158 RepID=A0A7Y9G928_9ACTN|nr:TIGR03619 family F420-dependent LLM class oxidoreductase [Actinomadura citrea]NYE12164.1 putative F420-dependent oxidoreductase [Actinomadura citrea]GGT50053.1 LLM class F420-dependent oxidoreductase [Actinomadura citrea]
MRLGITMFATDLTMAPHELAAEAEARGFASLYLPEHTHIPVSRATPPPTGDAALPEEYARTLDPLVSLAAAAVTTERIVLGTGVLLPAQREPIVTAKAVATLDRLAPGRVALGIGFGWNAEEGADHGVPWKRRRAVAREHVLAMRALWTDEEASFTGEFAGFAPSRAWPKPSRRVPVLLGGAPGPTLFAHIAEYGDGWMPIGGAGVREALPALRRACEDAGRAMVPVVPFGTLPTPGKLDHFASLGIEEVVLRVPAGDRDSVLPVLDGYARSHL